jgi:glycosyltransferase involved in cell wall biosynthesis
MKILHYINGLGAGGAEKLLTDILPLMKDKGHEVHLVISNEKNLVKKYYDILKAHGVEVTNLNSANFNPMQVFKMVRILRKGKYDIVHAHIFPSQYWLAFASWFKPRGTWLVKSEHNFYNNRRKYKALQFLEKIVYGRYAVIISITEDVHKSLKSWLKEVRSIVIPNGVNLKQIAKESAVGNAADYAFLKPGQYNILMVGRFSGAKDQNTLILAMKELPDYFHLFLAGQGPLIEHSKQFANSLGLYDRVHFLGMRTDVYSLMNRVDLNVLSTQFEGLSGVTLESLASGKPFIGSDVSGVNNIVPDSRLLFPVNQPGVLAEKIIEISRNEELSRQLVKISMAHVVRYDISYMCNKYLTVYEEIIK